MMAVYAAQSGCKIVHYSLPRVRGGLRLCVRVAVMLPVERKSSRLGIAYGYDCASTVDDSTLALLTDQAAHWDRFYTRNESKFFKDRHWMTREWPVLLDVERVRVCCELGCGVGNSV